MAISTYFFHFSAGFVLWFILRQVTKISEILAHSEGVSSKYFILVWLIAKRKRLVSTESQKMQKTTKIRYGFLSGKERVFPSILHDSQSKPRVWVCISMAPATVSQTVWCEACRQVSCGACIQAFTQEPLVYHARVTLHKVLPPRLSC